MNVYYLSIYSVKERGSAVRVLSVYLQQILHHMSAPLSQKLQLQCHCGLSETLIFHIQYFDLDNLTRLCFTL